ncbi:hypothetical protein CH306_26115 [Rhodococcus sp. 15-725-2-2b]|nr:hypothetical protein CH277_22545 [Rhodococcus sp. 06-469-3-2]OZD40792.1 hypothetical protein CH264_24230 [Rhodococcus sp. 06-1477-1A]OZE67100.1 hypothetical protein CH306_26115 [Rhodococcus sp. 15-725-2-2b]
MFAVVGRQFGPSFTFEPGSGRKRVPSRGNELVHRRFGRACDVNDRYLEGSVRAERGSSSVGAGGSFEDRPSDGV